jgi:hypothetical protein
VAAGGELADDGAADPAAGAEDDVQVRGARHGGSFCLAGFQGACWASATFCDVVI